MGKLEGRVAIVTGGARGMGASHVRGLLREGARVVFGDVLEDEGRLLEKELGEDCRFLPHDATSEEGWAAIVDLAMTTFGRVDVLVNNAGILGFGSLDSTSLEDFRRVIDVNLVSQWLGLKYASAVMGEGGSIVNISSLNGLVGGMNLTAYAASKFGVRGLTKSAAIELGPKGIRVNSVHPAGVATPMLGRAEDDVDSSNGPMANIPIPRMAYAHEVTEMVLFLASDSSSYSTGSEFVIDGGMSAGAGF
ncbi:SDR family oxidoreductase [Nocardioides sp. Root151]|uniref:SDR family oxidoreductase n=1 Tax=Nocardioides sp. Root151 TaxID=1736475 RepID=UPI00070361D8|nr:SDR family oxidoreductase [Nocardioides sp. Root151]KQZ74925.1 3-alpha-hydroxysteroid dehydrogenase [Nocardioides sp. Root151]